MFWIRCVEDYDDIYTFFSFSDVAEGRTSKVVYSPENTLKIMSLKPGGGGVHL